MSPYTVGYHRAVADVGPEPTAFLRSNFEDLYKDKKSPYVIAKLIPSACALSFVQVTMPIRVPSAE